MLPMTAAVALFAPLLKPRLLSFLVMQPPLLVQGRLLLLLRPSSASTSSYSMVTIAMIAAPIIPVAPAMTNASIIPAAVNPAAAHLPLPPRSFPAHRLPILRVGSSLDAGRIVEVDFVFGIETGCHGQDGVVDDVAIAIVAQGVAMLLRCFAGDGAAGGLGIASAPTTAVAIAAIVPTAASGTTLPRFSASSSLPQSALRIVVRPPRSPTLPAAASRPSPVEIGATPAPPQPALVVLPRPAAKGVPVVDVLRALDAGRILAPFVAGIGHSIRHGRHAVVEAFLFFFVVRIAMLLGPVAALLSPGARAYGRVGVDVAVSTGSPLLRHGG